MALAVSHHRDGDAVTVTVEGELDLSSADDLDRELTAAAAGDASPIIVDLSAVTFVDSAGINTLLKGRRVADEHRKQYRVTGAAGLVRQVLELTGVWTHLTGHAA